MPRRNRSARRARRAVVEPPRAPGAADAIRKALLALVEAEPDHLRMTRNPAPHKETHA